MANGYISDFFADIIVEAILTRNITKIPTSYFIGLTLELPTDHNGSGIVVPTAIEYGRFELTAEAISWLSNGIGSRSMSSNIDVIYQKAITDWGEINGYTVHDSLVDGNFLGYGITNPYTIQAGTITRLPAGLIDVALTI